jgi:uncharacterized membrane protein YhdT
MKNIKQITAFTLTTILTGAICSIVVFFVISQTCKLYEIRFEQTNIWGADFIFYLSFLFFPTSFVVQNYLKNDIGLSKYLVWFVFPMIYVTLYSTGICLGLIHQLEKIGISNSQSLWDFPMAINFNMGGLNYYCISGILVALIIEIIWIRNLKIRQ